MFWLLSVLLCLNEGILLHIPFNNRYFLYIWIQLVTKFSELFRRKFHFVIVPVSSFVHSQHSYLSQGYVDSVLGLSDLLVYSWVLALSLCVETHHLVFGLFLVNRVLCLRIHKHLLFTGEHSLFSSGSRRTWIHWLLRHRGNNFGSSWWGSEYGRGAKLVFGDVGNRSTAHWAGEREYGTWI